MSRDDVTKSWEYEVIHRNVPMCNEEFCSECNKAVATGVFEDDFTHYYEKGGINVYRAILRISKEHIKCETLIPILITEEILMKDIGNTSVKGKFAEVCGEIGSFHKYLGKGKKAAYARLNVEAINIVDTEDELELTNVNLVYLKGCIRSSIFYDREPMERLETVVLYLEVKKDANESQNVRCTAYGKKALIASVFKINDEIELYARFTSRELKEGDQQFPCDLLLIWCKALS